jgi:nucleoside-diphosphate kinase
MALVLSGENAIVRWREIMGATDPGKAAEGTIRKLYGTDVRYNATHGSDAPETARQEISFFFSGMSLFKL